MIAGNAWIRMDKYPLISDLLGSICIYQIALRHYLVLSGLDRATIGTYMY